MMSDTLQFSQFIVCNPWPRVCPAQYPDFVAIRGSKCIQHQSCIKEETWETLFICLFKSTKCSNDEKCGWMLSLQKRFKWTQIKMLYISGLQISLWIRYFSKFLKILYFSKIIFPTVSTVAINAERMHDAMHHNERQIGTHECSSLWKRLRDHQNMGACHQMITRWSWQCSNKREVARIKSKVPPGPSNVLTYLLLSIPLWHNSNVWDKTVFIWHDVHMMSASFI